MTRDHGARGRKPIKISLRRERVGVSIVEMLMCSWSGGAGRGRREVEERERVRRYEDVGDGMTW